jgi:tungstate transport system substrate-binding protein
MTHRAAGSFALGLAATLGLLFSCTGGPREIVLASTTSVEDSGLFGALLPAFRATHPEYRLRVIAVGSGEALRLAARGDADLVIAHSPAAEAEFMAAGHGESRRPIMHNDFVIVGPAGGPAAGCASSEAARAFACIAENGASFVSRGDDSGTHARELELWRAAGVEPGGAWYVKAGLGMGDVLMMASEKGAYTLADRATYLTLKGNLALDVLVEGDSALHNAYSVIVAAGAADREGARAFADWLTSAEGQSAIGAFGVARFGRALFTPEHAPSPD